MTKKLPHIVILLVVLSEMSCKENVADRPFVNQTPKTFLWLYPDSTVGIGVSRQRIRWWGEDPDGLVAGYLFSFKEFPTTVTRIPVPDTLRYTWVTKNDTLILFPLDTLFRKFTVIVRAVDNTFRGLPNQSIVRLWPSPYLDVYDNGVFDTGDTPLPDITPAMDGMGALQTFPVRNSLPTIAFAINPHDPVQPLRQPDTTFTVATFAFKGSDPDGDNTLLTYRIALNDTTNAASWVTIPLRDTVITLVVPRERSDTAGATVVADVYSGSFFGRRLVRQVPNFRLDAFNRFFVQVQDVAGEYSPILSLPSGTDTWYVRKPRGRLLLVSDFRRFDEVEALATYKAALDSVPGGQFSVFDYYYMVRGMSFSDKQAERFGTMIPHYVDPALIHTFLLFDYVCWYTEQFPSLWIAQLTLFPYIQNGGRVIFSTMFLNTLDSRGALRDFAPIDSVGSTLVSQTAFANYRLLPDSSNSSSIYPLLALNAVPIQHTVFLRNIYRSSSARYIYRLQPDTLSPPRYVGSPNLAVVDGLGKIVFVGLPLHLLDNKAAGNPRGLSSFFTKTLTESFSPSQRIDRRKF